MAGEVSAADALATGWARVKTAEQSTARSLITVGNAMLCWTCLHSPRTITSYLAMMARKWEEKLPAACAKPGVNRIRAAYPLEMHVAAAAIGLR
jgi:hypothetical protein